MKSIVPGLVALAVVAACAAIAVALVRPPAPVPETAPLDEFSSARAMKHLDALTARPHPVGSPENAAVRDYLVQTLAGLGLEHDVQVATGAVSLFRTAGTVHNVVARLRGTGSAGGAILLAAHYDSVPVAPGAGDDGSGVAAILETIRALKAGPPLQRDVIVLFTDGEEVGLIGADAFVTEHPWARDVALVMNFEARGSSGPAFMFETSSGNRGLVRDFASIAPYPSGSSLTYTIYKLLPNNTDFTVFRDGGMRGLNFAFIGGVGNYHTPLDSAANLDQGSLQHHGSYAVALTRAFANSRLDNVDEADAVYFNPLGNWFVSYPEAWVVPQLLIPVLLFAAVVTLAVRRASVRAGGAALGVLALGVGLAASLGLGWAAMWGLRALHGRVVSAGPIDESALYAFALVALAAAVTLAVYLVFRRWTSAQALTIGALAWWLALTVAASVLLPGASYLLFWPLVFALIGLAVALQVGPTRATIASVALTAGAMPAALILAPLAYTLFLAFGVSAIGAYALLAVTSLGFWPVAPALELAGDARRWILGSVGVACAAMLVAGVATVRFDAGRPAKANIIYGLDADTGRAVWASSDASNSWSAQFAGGAPERTSWPEFYPQSPGRRFLRADAPAVPLPAPEVTAIEDSTRDSRRVLRLRVVSRRGASRFSISLTGSTVTAAAVNGKPVGATGRRDENEPAEVWALDYYAPPEAGVELALELATAGPVRVRVVESTRGLPAVPGAESAPRPDWVVPVGLGDQTLVARSFEF